MNILTDVLPTQVLIDGQLYDLNTDFKTAIRIIQDFEDEELTVYEKNYLMIRRLYLVVPENTDEAVRLALRFLDGGETPEGDDENAPLRLYSFSKDANLIYAAFRQTHGIDLQSAKMHWWQFLALFMDLGAETTFTGLVSLRKRVKEGKATTDELKIATELGDAFEVNEPDMRSWEQIKEDERKQALSNEFMRQWGST